MTGFDPVAMTTRLEEMVELLPEASLTEMFQLPIWAELFLTGVTRVAVVEYLIQPRSSIFLATQER